MKKQLLDMLELSEEKTEDYLKAFTPSSTVKKKGDYLYYKGTSNILLMAHYDTAGKTGKPKRTNNYAYVNRGVLGADDKAGLAIALNILYSRLNTTSIPSVLFTNGEERGGLGAQAFVEDNHDLSHIDYIIGLDRRNIAEAVNYGEPSILDVIAEEVGYITKDGSYSDCLDVSIGYSIPHINVSVGFRDEHSVLERIYFRDLFYCRDMVNNLIDEIEGLTEEQEEIYSDLLDNQLMERSLYNLDDYYGDEFDYLDGHLTWPIISEEVI